MTRIAIIDDHPMVIDGLKAMIGDDPAIHIVVAETSPLALISKMACLDVDLLITDILMPEMNGNVLAKKVREEYPDIKILALSMAGQVELIDEMINDADISGFILKNVSKSELLYAVNKIMNGGIYFSDEMIDELGKYNENKDIADENVLTNREIQIIQLMEQEMGNKAIADKMFISERTVETHRKNIFRKLNKSTPLGVIKYAYDHKLITPSR